MGTLPIFVNFGGQASVSLLISFCLQVEQVVCCGLTPIQKELYQRLVSSKAAKIELGKTGNISFSSLAFITQLKKLCNHPELLLSDGKNEKGKGNGIEGLDELFPGKYNRYNNAFLLTEFQHFILTCNFINSISL